MADIVIRHPTKEELPQVLDLQNRVFHGEQQIPLDDPAEFLAKNPRFWCADQNGKIVGIVCAWKEDGKTHCGRFAVEPELRGQKIGGQLVRKFFDDLFAEGEEELYMEGREVTVKLVTGMGGKIVGETVPFYAGTITPMILRREDYHPC